MENKKRELRKIKRALYVCTAFLITNLGLSSCGVETKEEVKQEEISLEEEIKTVEVLNENLDGLKEDCILFQEVREDIEYDEISDSYMVGNFKVVRAEKNGVSYLLDERDNSVLLANIVSWGGPYYDYDGPEFNRATKYIVCLGVDGYDYTIDTSDFRTILEIKDTYYDKSPSFYLEGYGYVFEAKHNGFKYMLDAKTRYPLVKCYETYGPLYYDEELGCDVYCFTSDYYGENYYFATNDFKIILKQGKVLEKTKENN